MPVMAWFVFCTLRIENRILKSREPGVHVRSLSLHENKQRRLKISEYSSFRSQHFTLHVDSFDMDSHSTLTQLTGSPI